VRFIGENGRGAFMKKSLCTLLFFLTALFVATSICGAVTYNTIQISSASHIDGWPQINVNNYVVWRVNDYSDYEIFLYNGTSTIPITNNLYGDHGARINANDHVVWYGNDGIDYEIFLYDGSSTTQITNDAYFDLFPQINANDHVVWQGYDGIDYEIFLYDGSSTTQITNNAYNDVVPQINANGYVVWRGDDGIDYEIFLYDGTSTTQITNNAYNDVDPQINANGYVVWRGDDGSDYEIFLYDGTSTIQITNNAYNDLDPQINANGYIVWQGDGGSNSEIFMASPADDGFCFDCAYCDINVDGICDEEDLALFSLWHGWNDWDCIENNDPECICDLVPPNSTCDSLDGICFSSAFERPECRAFVYIEKIKRRQSEPGDAIRILGKGFGSGAPGDAIHLGSRVFEYGHPRIKLWTDTKIKLKIPPKKYTKNDCQWFNGEDFRRVKVWVTAGGRDSNKFNIKLLKPDTCP
jgi:hypothetical protein